MFAVAVAVDVALQLCFSLLLHLRGGADSKGKGSKGLFKSNSRVPRCHGGVQRGRARLLRVLIAITRDVVVDFSSIANRFNGRRLSSVMWALGGLHGVPELCGGDAFAAHCTPTTMRQVPPEANPLPRVRLHAEPRSTDPRGANP